MTVLVLLLLSLITGVHSVCYYPDGSVANGDVPCQSSGNSTCCGEGYACLSNNICQATGDELQLPEATEYVRGSCTDPTWRSASCPSFCITEAEDSGAGIIRCNTTEQLYYCTGDQNNATDCATDQNVFYFPGNATAITTIGIIPTTSTASLATTSSSPVIIVPPAIPASSPSSTNNGAVIGGAVGGAAGGIALIALAAWLFARRRRRRSETKADETDYALVQRTGREEDGEGMVHEAPALEAAKKPKDPCSTQELPAPADLVPPQELPA